MILPNKKPASTQRGPVLGGEASLAKLIARAKLRASLRKPAPAKPVKEEKKDTGVFGGKKQHATEAERRGWLRQHASEVWKITKGRVTSAKIPEYEKKLNNPKKWGPLIESYKHEPEKIKKDMQKAWWKAKTYKEKWEIKQDMIVVDKMYGLEKK